jgi:hypothetical protein
VGSSPNGSCMGKQLVERLGQVAIAFVACPAN